MVAELSALPALEDELLYVFVGGPGVGEGIAIALPGRAGWVVLDGAAVGGESIPVHLIRRFAERGYPERVAAFVMTQPP